MNNRLVSNPQNPQIPQVLYFHLRNLRNLRTQKAAARRNWYATCAKAALALLLLLPIPSAGQETDRRQVEADLRIARTACTQAVDSGSVGAALDRLRRIDPSYSGVKALLDRCSQVHKDLLEKEDLTFAEAKAAYERGANDEARNKFQLLANRRTQRTADALRYLGLIAGKAGAAPAPGGSTSQQDFNDLDLAKRNIQAQKYDKAKPALQVLVGKGSPLAEEAKKWLDFIDRRLHSQTMHEQGLQAIRQKRFQDALNLAQDVQRQDPDYPGLAMWLKQAYSGLGTSPPAAAPVSVTPSAAASPAARPAPNADFERGKSLFIKKDFTGAEKAFREAQASPSPPSDVQTWIQKAQAARKDEEKQVRGERLLEEARGLLGKKDYVRAYSQLRKAQVFLPGDEEITQLLNEARAGVKRMGAEAAVEDRSAVLATVLENGLREFYAGNSADAQRLFNQYIRDGGKQAALAYFYLGVVASTEFFLGGAGNPDKEAEARQFFVKGRQASARFEPPREWVSPKILAIYDKTAAGR